MYENMTYEYLMEQLLSNVPTDVSTSEGSVVYSALSPLAYELERAYIEMDVLLKQTYAETSDYDYLELRAKERGLTPIQATYCKKLAVFNVAIPTGTRFLISNLYWTSGEIHATPDGYTGFCYLMTCETAGTTANAVSGELTLIECPDSSFDINSIESAELLETATIPARDKESQEDFLARYHDSFNAQAFGGNIADYLEKIHSIEGVGGVHIYPVWNGGGTVKAIIIGADYEEASADLVTLVKNTMDPDNGLGGGLCPIGHVLTVASATGVNISITATVTPQTGTTTSELQTAIETAMENYLAELRKDWEDEYLENQQGLVVRLAEIESRILNVDGVLDVADATINGTASNLALTDAQIPILEEVVI